MQIHIARNGQKFGPYTVSEVNDYLGTGFLKPEDSAWHEGLSDWQPLSSIQGVHVAASRRRTPPPPPAAAPASARVVTLMKPDNYMVSAILATLFCCLPFGIVAIVYACQVDSKWAAGDHAGATVASGHAKMWCNLAAGIGLLVIVLWGFAVVGSRR